MCKHFSTCYAHMPVQYSETNGPSFDVLKEYETLGTSLTGSKNNSLSTISVALSICKMQQKATIKARERHRDIHGQKTKPCTADNDRSCCHSTCITPIAGHFRNQLTLTGHNSCSNPHQGLKTNQVCIHLGFTHNEARNFVFSGNSETGKRQKQLCPAKWPLPAPNSQPWHMFHTDKPLERLISKGSEHIVQKKTVTAIRAAPGQS
jgi:hypothetical protein